MAKVPMALAKDGGKKVRTRPWPAEAKRFGAPELKQLKEALDQNTLFYTRGKKTEQLYEKMRALTGARHVVACSSGSAAIHGALKAAGIGPGDEVITTPITDAGTILWIVYEGAIPVFADVDPETWAVTLATVAAKITPRTRAVIAVHLMGNPLDMRGLTALCRKRNLKLIEDCAQAWGAKLAGKSVGTFGDFGCFSLNDFKHIGAGDGGLIIAKKEEDWRRAWFAIDKCYDRITGKRALEFVAPNYRITELQSAVAIAQMDRLPGIVEPRNRLGGRLAAGVRKIPGFYPVKSLANSFPTWWFFLIGIDRDKIAAPTAEIVEMLAAEGIGGLGVGYVNPPVHIAYPYLAKRQAFAHSKHPFDLYKTAPRYAKGDCPVAERVAGDCIQFFMKEWLTDREIDDALAALAKVGAHCVKTA